MNDLLFNILKFFYEKKQILTSDWDDVLKGYAHERESNKDHIYAIKKFETSGIIEPITDGHKITPHGEKAYLKEFGNRKKPWKDRGWNWAIIDGGKILLSSALTLWISLYMFQLKSQTQSPPTTQDTELIQTDSQNVHVMSPIIADTLLQNQKAESKDSAR